MSASNLSRRSSKLLHAESWPEDPSLTDEHEAFRMVGQEEDIPYIDFGQKCHILRGHVHLSILFGIPPIISFISNIGRTVR